MVKNSYLQKEEWDTNLKLKTKLYLFQIVLSTVLFIFLGLNYYSYQYQFKKDIDTYVKNEITVHKKEILTSINRVNKEFEKRKQLIYDIHQYALEIVRNDININLSQLQQKLKEKFHLENNLEIEIYLIDKSYTIYKTTFPKDLGFNLSIAADAKGYLDKTSVDGKICVSEFASTDSMNMEYKLYTYSKLTSDKYLELGFVDNRLNNNSVALIAQNIDLNSKLTIYNVGKNEKEYYYYEMNFQNEYKNKEDFFKTVKRFPLNQTNNDPILKTQKENNSIIIDNGDTQISYSNIFNDNMYKVLGFENLVMKLEIDISDKKEFIQNYQQMFIISLIVISLLLVILYIFIQKSFTKPIDTITQSLNNTQKVDDKSILSLDNELSTISKKYNTLFDKLSNEIDLNQKLLNENKRFIADTVHQLRTPLTNIMMSSEMVKKFQKDDSITSFIDKIDSSINMLSNSYEDLAYITTADTIEYKPNRIDLSSMLNKRIKFFNIISKVNKKELVSNIQSDSYVYINDIELERIIDNNISNGIKYATKEKPITINLTNTTDTVTVEFKTYGEPIKNKEKIFEKNYRENEAKRGLGLGLNMVKNICEKYEITYSVTYEDGQNIFIYTFKNA